MSQRWRQPCLSQKFQNYLWPWLLRELADSRAGARNTQDVPKGCCRDRKSTKMHICVCMRTHTHTTMGACRRHRSQLKELPMAKAREILSNKINNVVLGYSPKHKLNGQESILIELNERMRENMQICAEEFRMIYVNTPPSRRWSVTPSSLCVGCTK